jgi:hypothetical protein
MVSFRDHWFLVLGWASWDVRLRLNVVSWCVWSPCLLIISSRFETSFMLPACVTRSKKLLISFYCAVFSLANSRSEFLKRVGSLLMIRGLRISEAVDVLVHQGLNPSIIMGAWWIGNHSRDILYGVSTNLVIAGILTTEESRLWGLGHLLTDLPCHLRLVNYFFWSGYGAFRSSTGANVAFETLMCVGLLGLGTLKVFSKHSLLLI